MFDPPDFNLFEVAVEKIRAGPCGDSAHGGLMRPPGPLRSVIAPLRAGDAGMPATVIYTRGETAKTVADDSMFMIQLTVRVEKDQLVLSK